MPSSLFWYGLNWNVIGIFVNNISLLQQLIFSSAGIFFSSPNYISLFQQIYYYYNYYYLILFMKVFMFYENYPFSREKVSFGASFLVVYENSASLFIHDKNLTYTWKRTLFHVDYLAVSHYIKILLITLTNFVLFFSQKI